MKLFDCDFEAINEMLNVSDAFTLDILPPEYKPSRFSCREGYERRIYIDEDCSHCGGSCMEPFELYEPTTYELMHCSPRTCGMCNGAGKESYWDTVW